MQRQIARLSINKNKPIKYLKVHKSNFYAFLNVLIDYWYIICSCQNGKDYHLNINLCSDIEN